MRWSRLILLMMLSAAPLHAQSVEDPAVFAAQLEPVVTSLLAGADIPGVAVALIHDRELVWSAGYGVIDREAQTVMSADTVFPVSAFSPTITAWAVMTLVEAGAVDLDNPIQNYLTTWTLPTTRHVDQITVRRVLNQTSGVNWTGYGSVTPGDITLPTALELLSLPERPGRFEWRTPPGLFQYSNANYMLLQLLIEEVSGISFIDYVEQTLLIPLEMTHSTFRLDPQTASPDVQGDLTTGYEQQLPVHDTPRDTGASGLYSTANDLARFVVAHMDEQVRGDILAADTVEQLFTTSDVDFYALGYYTTLIPQGERLISVPNYTHGYLNFMAFLPDAGEGIVVLINSDDDVSAMTQIICVWDAWLSEDLDSLCKANWNPTR
jgi:CubicO group peptidase (beta-lactamase class C family)